MGVDLGPPDELGCTAWLHARIVLNIFKIGWTELDSCFLLSACIRSSTSAHCGGRSLTYKLTGSWAQHLGAGLPWTHTCQTAIFNKRSLCSVSSDSSKGELRKNLHQGRPKAMEQHESVVVLQLCSAALLDWTQYIWISSLNIAAPPRQSRWKSHFLHSHADYREGKRSIPSFSRIIISLYLKCYKGLWSRENLGCYWPAPPKISREEGLGSYWSYLFHLQHFSSAAH